MLDGLFEKTGVDQVKSYIKEESQQTEVVVKREESVIFESYSQANLSLTSQFEETEFVALVNPKRGSFEGEARNWSFRMGGSDQVITATIRDQVFLDKVESGEIKPHHRDLLKVKIAMKQEIRDQEVSRAVYEIKEVLEYNPTPGEPKQNSLIPDNGEGGGK